MPWVKLDDHFPDHRKLAELGSYAPVCGWLYVCGLAYCNRQLTDGLIPKVHIHRLASFRHLSIETGLVGPKNAPIAGMGEDLDPEDLAERLVDVGLWEDADDFYRVHDYEEFQFTKAEVEQMREQRREAGRLGGIAKGKRDANHIASEVPSKSSSKNLAKVCPVPVPVPLSDPVHTQTVTAHSKPLGYKPRIDVAWPGRPNVPGSLHEEFVVKLGGDPEESRRRLREWYPIAAAPYEDKPIGDDDWKFWRLRFREWQGTTAKPVTAGTITATDDEIWADIEAQKALRVRR